MDKSLLSISAPEGEREEKLTAKPEKGRMNNLPFRTVISFAVYLVLIPMVIIAGVKLFADRKYNIISVIIAFLACVPFFIGFEKGKTGARELVVIAVMTAISVLGRLIFAPIPGFKPVTAVVIITGIAYGMQAGFLTGALSAIVSNIFYGQGPWTPFQMFVWGFLGLLAGLIFKRGQKPNVVVLIAVGVLGGVLFSVMMDIWSVLSMDGTWNLSRYLALLVSSLPFMAVYAVSNVVFLLLLTKPFLQKLNRVKDKYGLFG
ncbi:MAG: ECF transporter S component [Eubacteriales bacterium]|nr:ECF transporter S component [Christensenellaceae bacterium]MDY3242075.1 ECF transporter S component [Eubacteriales bacterium]MDY4710313.1 ECF transporter S component [Eubacteriales bacterium]